MLNVKKRLKGKRITLKNKRGFARGRNKRKYSICRRAFYIAKFACHGSLQDAGDLAATQNAERRYPGYYTH
jgi:hypothetical protein